MLASKLKKIGLPRAYWLPILSGIFIGTSYIPFPAWALAFAYVPLWSWWIEQKNGQRIWWGGWWTQFILNLIGFNWVIYTLHTFAHLSWPLAGVGLLLYCSFAGLHIPLSGLLWWKLTQTFKPQLWLKLSLLPASAALMEFIYPMIFDWHLGYPLLQLRWPLYHLAEWIGFKGLSTMVFIFNALILFMFLHFKLHRQPAKGLHEKSSHRKKIILVGAFTISLLVTMNLLGQWLKMRLPLADQTARVLVVQANIGNTDDLFNQYQNQFFSVLLNRFITLTQEGLKSAEDPSSIDFAVWPEAAFPQILGEPYFHTNPYVIQLRNFLSSHQLSLITGAYSLHPQQKENLVSNSLFILNSHGEMADVPYAKHRLLVFGEYIPGIKYFPFIKKWIPEMGEFTKGPGPEVKHLNQLKIGPLICYESLFDDLSRSLALQGAQILVNVTNDSWYGTWQEPFQHLQMTMARAIETRRPLIRSTNTGISTVVLADGTPLITSPLHQEWAHLYKVPYLSQPPTTVFMGVGQYFSWFFIFIILGAVILNFFCKVKKS